MKTQILLITHENIGRAMLKIVKRTFGQLPMPIKVVAIDYQTDPDDIVEKLIPIAESTSQEEGILILTDMFGATPCNVALALRHYKHIHVVSGLNLPMLIKVLNYPGMVLYKLAKKAMQGGKEGVVNCSHEYEKICEME